MYPRDESAGLWGRPGEQRPAGTQSFSCRSVGHEQPI